MIREARSALRRFREARAEGAAPKRSAEEPWRLQLDVPLPVASDVADRGVRMQDAPFSLLDEGDWPGGQLQRFRALRTVVEPLLEGYDAGFIGMLESPADGLGVWQLKDLVLAGIVVNASFQPFLKLCEGGFGAQPTKPDQAVIVVQDWTRGGDIGQPWQRDLRAKARALIDDAQWQPLYACRMVRTSRGKAFGCLTGGWGVPWRLYPADTPESSSIRNQVLLEAEAEPTAPEIIAALNAAAEERKARGEGPREESKGLWW